MWDDWPGCMAFASDLWTKTQLKLFQIQINPIKFSKENKSETYSLNIKPFYNIPSYSPRIVHIKIMFAQYSSIVYEYIGVSCAVVNVQIFGPPPKAESSPKSSKGFPLMFSSSNTSELYFLKKMSLEI